MRLTRYLVGGLTGLVVIIGTSGLNPTRAAADTSEFFYTIGSSYNWVKSCPMESAPTELTFGLTVQSADASADIFDTEPVVLGGFGNGIEGASDPDYAAFASIMEGTEERTLTLTAEFGGCLFTSTLHHVTLPEGANINAVDLIYAPPVAGETGFGEYRVGPWSTFETYLFVIIIGQASEAVSDSDGDGLFDESELDRGSDPLNVDSDGDSVWDLDEMFGFGTNPASTDSDNDGLADADEWASGLSHPSLEDTDLDGLMDADEFAVYRTEAWNPDSDFDGLRDGLEVTHYGTNPTGDTDGDALDDGREIELGTDPFSPDSDGDELWDGMEADGLGLDPLDPDTDDDGLSDFEFLLYNTSPFLADSDFDGLTDGDEVLIYGTNPTNPFTDGDSLLDADELFVYGTDPLDFDTDDDMLLDDTEVLTEGTDPLDPDTDDDGLPDIERSWYGTSALDADHDDDGLTDGAEVNQYGTQPRFPDTDLDGLLDGAEIALGSNPKSPDTDADTVMDGTDNCVLIANADQADLDSDGAGDPCDADDDGDSVVDSADACPASPHGGFDADADGCRDSLPAFETLVAGSTGLVPNASSHIIAKAAQTRDKYCSAGDSVAALDKLSGLRGFIADNAGTAVPDEYAALFDGYLANLVAQVAAGNGEVCGAG